MRYAILGPARAENDEGTPVPLGGPRLRALLTALALRADRPVPVSTLVDDIWSTTPPEDAPAALQALVARLRRALGRQTITSEPGAYRLATAPATVDLFAFEHLLKDAKAALARGDDPATAATALREALSLWRGPALADLPDRTAAARPEALRAEATRTRIEADLRLGRAPDLVPELRELTGSHPYDEPLHALLIRALHEAGRTAEALAAYEAVRRALRDTLGTDPGWELRALHALLLDPDAGRPSTNGSHPGPAPSPGPAGGHPGAGRPTTPRPTTPQPPPPYLPTSDSSAPHPRTGNLRPRLTSFVGRERELDAIRSDLRGTRLVTLTGPGGSGKTRLAEEAATAHPRAWLAELAPLDRPEAVPGAVVSALGLRETALITHELAAAQDDPVALLVEHCAQRDLLLILDNCEHVIEAAADLAETLLTHCPGLTILATSREPLGVPGETVRPVEPLLPAPAHHLFADRAASARPDADTVLRADPEAVDEICHRLDGLPLAIELAAARLRLLTPRQIADRLDDRFRLLTSGSRTALPRQQTLRAVVDWSWDLLDEAERTMLREVSVFAGGWDLGAAEEVCASGAAAADLLGALVDKSLVVATPYEHDSRVMRYRMLETIHEYATERAAETPALRTAAELRHTTWVRGLLAEAEPRLRSAEQLPWIHRLETDLDNIRAALHRALTTADEATATHLALSMGWFWWLRNFRQEGAQWVDRILRLGATLDERARHHRLRSVAPPRTTSHGVAPPDPLEAPEAPEVEAPDPVAAFLADPAPTRHPRHHPRMALRLLHLALIAESGPIGVPNDPQARAYITRLRALSGHTGPAAARFPGLVWPLTAYMLDGTATVDIRAMMDEAVANCREHGGDWELGFTLMLRTHMLVDSSGNMLGVEDDLTELRAIADRVGDRWMRAQVRSAAGEAAMARGRFSEAKGAYEEALHLAYEVGANAESPFLIARLGEIAYRSGDREAALAALEEATAAADRFGVPDSRAFVSLLRAHMALDDGDHVQARALWRSAHEETRRGTPPPQFKAFLDLVDGLVTTAESGPAAGLRRLTEALRTAVDNRCAETVIAALADSAATVLSRLGDHARAVRLLAAANRWRGDHPCALPEHDEHERTRTAALTALGGPRHDAEADRGRTYTPRTALADLSKSLESLEAL
ncbi:AfsR family transcriptional regulator [Streptomyces sp. JV178]|uniref:AfsR/SARP family transcriptional regulator n=1 Tax=Streptomyces sp. JV178 TaxID=858632 RepID=UPI000C1B35E9|nr:BTAD domain-containing putative transcriptional regulator [Streptomyces sp. JV178]PIM70395.1 AfsR family transcriptional regulator [Streptomyces sp. JV178]